MRIYRLTAGLLALSLVVTSLGTAGASPAVVSARPCATDWVAIQAVTPRGDVFRFGRFTLIPTLVVLSAILPAAFSQYRSPSAFEEEEELNNPSHPLSPLNPGNPASPLSPFNPISPLYPQYSSNSDDDYYATRRRQEEQEQARQNARWGEYIQGKDFIIEQRRLGHNAEADERLALHIAIALGENPNYFYEDRYYAQGALTLLSLEGAPADRRRARDALLRIARTTPWSSRIGGSQENLDFFVGLLGGPAERARRSAVLLRSASLPAEFLTPQLIRQLVRADRRRQRDKGDAPDSDASRAASEVRAFFVENVLYRQEGTAVALAVFYDPATPKEDADWLQNLLEENGNETALRNNDHAVQTFAAKLKRIDEAVAKIKAQGEAERKKIEDEHAHNQLVNRIFFTTVMTIMGLTFLYLFWTLIADFLADRKKRRGSGGVLLPFRRGPGSWVRRGDKQRLFVMIADGTATPLNAADSVDGRRVADLLNRLIAWLPTVSTIAREEFHRTHPLTVVFHHFEFYERMPTRDRANLHVDLVDPGQEPALALALLKVLLNRVLVVEGAFAVRHSTADRAWWWLTLLETVTLSYWVSLGMAYLGPEAWRAAIRLFGEDGRLFLDAYDRANGDLTGAIVTYMTDFRTRVTKGDPTAFPPEGLLMPLRHRRRNTLSEAAKLRFAREADGIDFVCIGGLAVSSIRHILAARAAHNGFRDAQTVDQLTDDLPTQLARKELAYALDLTPDEDLVASAPERFQGIERELADANPATLKAWIIAALRTQDVNMRLDARAESAVVAILKDRQRPSADRTLFGYFDRGVLRDSEVRGLIRLFQNPDHVNQLRSSSPWLPQGWRPLAVRDVPNGDFQAGRNHLPQDVLVRFIREADGVDLLRLGLNQSAVRQVLAARAQHGDFRDSDSLDVLLGPVHPPVRKNVWSRLRNQDSALLNATPPDVRSRVVNDLRSANPATLKAWLVGAYRLGRFNPAEGFNQRADPKVAALTAYFAERDKLRPIQSVFDLVTLGVLEEYDARYLMDFFDAGDERVEKLREPLSEWRPAELIEYQKRARTAHVESQALALLLGAAPDVLAAWIAALPAVVEHFDNLAEAVNARIALPLTELLREVAKRNLSGEIVLRHDA